MITPTLPCPPVEVQVLPGRTVTLERLDVQRHGAGLWEAVGARAELWTHIPSGPFADRAEFTEWLRVRAERPGLALFTVLDRTGPDPVPAGLYFLLNIDPDQGRAEIGLVYGPALSRRVGGTEAFHLLAGHVLGTLGYRRLEWQCTVDNTASLRAARRFGFTQEGVLRQAAWRKGVNWDSAVLSILDREWPALDARFRAWLDPANFDAGGRQIRPLAG